ncbi:MAG TPA: hypothetical protein VGL40_15025 [Bacillota bacterium]
MSTKAGQVHSPRELAVACGWLAHQIADFYPHYAPVDAQGALVEAGATNGSPFKGYANSHRVLGTSFYSEVLNEYTTLDHGLIEFFHDCKTTSKLTPRRH